MERVNLIFLHGFLGRPKDWNLTIDFLKAGRPQIEVISVDLFHDELLNPHTPLSEWGDTFGKWLQKNVDRTSRNILVGYSLGGRLALHALEKNANLLERVVIVSANTGFRDQLSDFDSDSQERKDRWIHDANWAELFLKAPWTDVVKNWNSQPVFGSANKEPVRIEGDYSRESLGLALTNWSLAQQKDFRSVVEKNLNKVSWLVGDQDEKYISIARTLEQDIPGFHFDVIRGSSHRILFDEPRLLAEKIKAKI